MNQEEILKRLKQAKEKKEAYTNNSDKFLKLEVPKQYKLRIVPYKYNKDSFYIETFMYYALFDKSTILSPLTRKEPDPINELYEVLNNIPTKDKDTKECIKKLKPKERIYIPVLVRGEEDKGVRFWGISNEVYASILELQAGTFNEEGVITEEGFILDDIKNGHDLIVSTNKDGNSQYYKTNVKPAKNPSPLAESKEQISKYISEQVEFKTLYKHYTYDELHQKLYAWLETDADAERLLLPLANKSVRREDPPTTYSPQSNKKEEDREENSHRTESTNVSMDDDFDNLFDN